MSKDDLSGHWSGCYSYPNSRPPVPFDAVLRDAGGSLTGSISEHDDWLGRARDAVVDGRRSSRSVRFVKMYEQADERYDTVHYQGELSDDGDEIGGEWTIPGIWSGTFLMVRSAGAESEQAKRASEKV